MANLSKASNVVQERYFLLEDGRRAVVYVYSWLRQESNGQFE